MRPSSQPASLTSSSRVDGDGGFVRPVVPLAMSGADPDVAYS